MQNVTDKNEPQNEIKANPSIIAHYISQQLLVVLVLDAKMLQLLIIGYVIYEIVRLSNLPDAGSYALPQQPQPTPPVSFCFQLLFKIHSS